MESQYTKEQPLSLTFYKTVECEVEYWYEDGSDPSYYDIAHIQSQIDEGYIEGELLDGENRGWWKITS